MTGAAGPYTTSDGGATEAEVRTQPRRAILLPMLAPALLATGCASHPPPTLDALYQQARLLERQGEAERALAAADLGLVRAQEQHHLRRSWKFRLLKAESLLDKGETSAARNLLADPAPLPPGAEELQARRWLDRGRTEYAVAEYTSSLSDYDRASRLARNGHFDSLLTEIELGQGVSLIRLGRASEAAASFRGARARARRQRDVYLEASALGNLGFLRMNGARYDEAMDRFRQALPLFEKFPCPRLVARTLNNLGTCLMEVGDPEKAASLFEQAAERATQSGLPDELQMSLGRMGDCYYDRGELQTALKYYERALEAARSTQARFWMANWLYDLATTYIELRDLGGAERFNNQALALQAEMQNPVEHFWPLLNAARIAELKKHPDAAERIYRAVIRGTRAESGIRDPALTLEARSRLARLLVATGHPDRAERQYRETVALIDRTRSGLTRDEHRLTYLSSLIHFYQDYVDLLVTRGRPAEALEVAEHSRARLLAESLHGQDHSTAPVAPSELQALARRTHTLLLAYWLAPQHSFLWVVTPTRLRTFTLPAEQEIARTVKAYGRAIDNLRDPIAAANPAGISLYETLLAPARSLIPSGSSVAIAPDGELCNLNFAALPVPDSRPHYWVEDVTISIVPSLSTLAGRPTPADETRANLLLMGDPISADANLFPPLPNARREIDRIGSQFPPSRKRVLTGMAAVPPAYAAARPERFSIIHFTAHASTNWEDPLDSAVILSPHDGDSKLYAREVLTHPIHARLVTLSACHSAGARPYAGEGLVGFAWVFLRAGARHVIAGLWEVDDRSTAELMARLYAGLRRGLGPPAALRSAQLGLIASEGVFHKPYYWAPFEVFADSLEPQTRTVRRLADRRDVASHY